ncbi:TlpA family protein disulfide reductase [Aquimarina brevivitae]|uniref:Thioredoxin-like protein n=1 Tax=Aquimarina brevivitae TaxID=323412 RepID=A0A4Q7PG70_9FLAO|nr:TlpA disulfide reductase family protein [Aquimarina brevivitae]RZS99355.1 thioredoxin-like protein [Aquimarina brevivitae]
MRNTIHSFIFVIFSFTACKKENKPNEDIQKTFTVDLTKETTNGPFGWVLSPFGNVDSLSKKFNNVPDLTYSNIQSIRFNSTKEVKSLLAKGLIDSTEFRALTNPIYAFSGLQGDNQVMVLDLNGNFDFGDDELYTFDASLREKTSNNAALRDSFPLVHFKFKRYYKNKVVNRDRYVRVIPYKDYFYTKKDASEAIKRHNDLLLVAARYEHLLGSFAIEQDSFKIAAELYNDDVDFLFTAKDNPFFPRRNTNEYEEFNEGDTLQLGQHFIIIDSIGSNFDKVFLEKLNISALPNGYKMGHTLKDYTLTDISGNKQRVSWLLNNKKLLLIDFWGTWCAPCLKLTPDLKEFHKKYPKVAMLGVDYDFEKEPGVTYIKEKKLDWTHIYVERVRNDSLLHNKIVGKLRVDNYPTFLLIDKDL